MGRLQEFKERVNKNSSIRITIEEAEAFIAEFLTNPYLSYAYTNLGLKLRLLYCAKVSQSEKIGIRQDQISYCVKTYPNNTTVAGLRRIKGDGTYTIEFNERRVKSSSALSFLIAVLHEYGHLSLTEREIKGEIIPPAIMIDHELELQEDEWQQRGAEFKYESSRNEFMAQDYARRMIRYYLSLSRGKNFIDGIGAATKNYLGQKCEQFKYIKAQRKLNRWQKISKARGIPESDLVEYVPTSDGVPAVIKEIDKKIANYSRVTSVKLAKDLICSVKDILHQGDFDVEDDYRFKVELMDAYCYLLSEKLSCKREDVGYATYIDMKSFVELVEPIKYDKNSVLYAYFFVDRDGYDNLSPAEFARQTIQSMEAILENQSEQ